jgi:hypothetical protein
MTKPVNDSVITLDDILPEYSLKSFAPALTGLTLREGVELTMFNFQVYEKLYFIHTDSFGKDAFKEIRRMQNDLYDEVEIIEEALQKSNDVY